MPFDAASAATAVQMSVVDLGTLETGRRAVVNLWYPRGACPDTSDTLCLDDAAVDQKVVVLSPGSMGTATEYSWIAEGVASAGLIVVGVNHYGESRIYGKDSLDFTSTSRTWQRAQDVSGLLDALSQRTVFQRSVRWDRVVAIGHSAGGQTVALLAGARFDLRRIANYCASSHAAGDRSCQYATSSASAPESWVQLFNASYQDARVRKLVLLDPALGSVLNAESGASIKLPSLVVGATQNDFLPWKSHGARYAAAIPGAQTLSLSQGEGHFVFLTPCTHGVEVMGVALCKDRSGVDRQAVQAGLVTRIVDFVQLNNEPTEVVRQANATQGVVNMNVPQNRVLQILYFTPRWVFGLLAVLCLYGWWQSRPRTATLAAALILPVSMMVWSAVSMFGYVDHQLLAIAGWLLGAATVAALRLKFLRDVPAKFDTGTGRLQLKGSWTPLLVILGIFFTRYALGVAAAMRAELMQVIWFQGVIAVVLGAWSGYFVSQAITLVRVRSAAVARVAIVE
jgi:predicted dienelactone hydrolase